MPTKYNMSYTKAQVAKKAKEIRTSYFSDENSPRLAFLKIFEKLGGVVEYREDGKKETLEVTSKGFTIYLPHSSSAARDNFTIAHELGHYFLHTSDYSAGGKVVHTRDGSNREEWEANWFAADLLMPEEEFRRAAAKSPNPEVLGKCFGVSGSAAQVRMSVLGIE